jgi:THUMP domain-like/RNA cap guanine-N2 methyltransferase
MQGSVSTARNAPAPPVAQATAPTAGNCHREDARRCTSLKAMNADPTVLLTPPGQELLALLAAEPDGGGTPLAVAVRLRRHYPADLVAAATAQHELRLAARAKFSRAMQMLFTRAGYEQSSAEPIARYRAARFGGATRVADLCCGIGGDLLALASGREALAVDRDDVHARLALHNAAVYGQAANVRAVVADVRDIRLDGLDAVFIDPARRSGPGTAGGPARTGTAARTGAAAPAGAPHRFRTGLSEPPLDWCFALAERVPAVCVKAAPGLPAGLIPDGWEAEFIADGRDLKEAVLWSPALATAPAAGSGGPRRALVLSGSGAHALVACPGDPVPVTEPREYLLDPNPAVTRSGLVEDLARALSASDNPGDSPDAGTPDGGSPNGGGDVAKIDPQIAFLTLDRPVQTPFARTLRVLDSAPWNEKRFARRLRELGIGAADIRRRGLAGDVDQIHRRLKLAGPNRATIVITRVNDKPWGLICGPVD